MQSYYDVLGVESTATREEIRFAYRQAVRALHPDQHGHLPEAAARERTEQLVAVTDAWRVLGDEDRRRLYDQVWQAAARRIQLVSGGLSLGSGVGADAGDVTDRNPWAPLADVLTSRSMPVGRSGSGGTAPVAPIDSRHTGNRVVGNPSIGDRWSGFAPTGRCTSDGPNCSGRAGGPGAGVKERSSTDGGWRPGSHPGLGGTSYAAGGDHRGGRWRDRRPDECRLCGGAPAVTVDLRCHRSGLLSSVYSGGATVERGPLCRQCGLAVLRELTDVALCGGIRSGRFADGRSQRSLVGDVLAFGWLFNLLTVMGNLSFWFRLWRLPEPTRASGVRVPLAAPLDPGVPLRERRGMAVVTAAVAIFLAVVAGLLVAGLVVHGSNPVLHPFGL